MHPITYPCLLRFENCKSGPIQRAMKDVMFPVFGSYAGICGIVHFRGECVRCVPYIQNLSVSGLFFSPVGLAIPHPDFGLFLIRSRPGLVLALLGASVARISSVETPVADEPRPGYARCHAAALHPAGGLREGRGCAGGAGLAAQVSAMA